MSARDPRSLGPDDLVLCHFSLDRQHPLEDRIEAAAAAGLAGISVYLREYARLAAAGLDADRLAAMLEAHDLCLAELEVVRVWPASPEEAAREAASEQLAWELADRFGCRYLQAIGPTPGEPEATVAGFAELCDRAAEHGMVVGLEFLPFTDIVTAADALAIVEAADRPNGGVCVDIWHHTRGANDLDLIRAIPAGRVTGIQMSDGPLTQELDSYYEDCLRRRVPPGEGEMDVVGFVAALLGAGVTVPWGLEVCQEAVWGQPAAQHVRRSADGMRSALTAARGRLADGT